MCQEIPSFESNHVVLEGNYKGQSSGGRIIKL